jgi:hypothetical protein
MKLPLQFGFGALQLSVPLPQCGNLSLAKPLVNVAGTESPRLRALERHIFRVFPHWFNPIDVPQLRHKLALNHDASVTLKLVDGKHWSNAVWPARAMRRLFRRLA